MFGTYRTLLALMVVFQHVGRLPVLGEYAVFGFYILSGYLMTFILHESYGYSRAGRARYALNRFLRIYPIYWLSCLFSLALIGAYGSAYASAYHAALYLPHDFEAVLRNVLLVSSQHTRPRLTPPSWALTVEIFFYACIGLGLSRARVTTGVWFVASVLYTVTVNALDMGHYHTYQSIPAASLPFSTGALIFQHRDGLKRAFGGLCRGRHVPWLLFVLIPTNWALGHLLEDPRGFSFYVNYLLCAVMVVALFGRTSLPLVGRRLDKLLGDFSYPIYLIHVQVGLLVGTWLAGPDASGVRPGLTLAFASLPVLFPLAWLMTVAVERPIETLRARVKAPAGPLGGSPPSLSR